jgi:cation diffusion facilitator family transporter
VTRASTHAQPPTDWNRTVASIPAPAIMKNPLTRTAIVAVVAAVATIALKLGAWWVTGSVSLLSDAVESAANLVAAMTALFAVWYAARPIDRNHNYGHEKIEFFASGLEGTLILVAGGAIIWFSVHRLLDPMPIEGFGAGVAIASLASIINLVVARMLIRVGRMHRSIALEADGRHLLTDVVTSAGVVIGLLIVRATGIDAIDPIVALLVALNILWTGLTLIRASIDGLMDTALDEPDIAKVRQAIAASLSSGETYHALRTRRAGSRRFIDFHLLVPGNQSVRRAHTISRDLEIAVANVLPGAETTVHIEPIEDPEAWDDLPLMEANASEEMAFAVARP